MDITTTTQLRFREDFGVKINLCEPNDFQYFIDLFDPVYNTKQKWEWTQEVYKVFHIRS